MCSRSLYKDSIKISDSHLKYLGGEGVFSVFFTWGVAVGRDLDIFFSNFAQIFVTPRRRR